MVSTNIILNASLQSRLLVNHIPDEFKQVEMAMPSDDYIYQAAVPDNHERLLRMKGVSTLKCEVTMSQYLIAE